VETLGITSPEEAMVLLVVDPGDDVGSATANLVAPVVLTWRRVVADRWSSTRTSRSAPPSSPPDLLADHRPDGRRP
jgi:hypothetical protein